MTEQQGQPAEGAQAEPAPEAVPEAEVNEGQAAVSGRRNEDLNPDGETNDGEANDEDNS